MKIFPRQTIFFSVSLSVKTFFSGVIFLQTIFFMMPEKKLVGLFLLLQTNFTGFPHPPPPLNLYDLPMVYNALLF